MNKNNCGNPQLKELLEGVLEQKNELDTAEINWVDDETVELKNVSNISLNTFLIQAEQQGKDITYTKQTIIQIA